MASTNSTSSFTAVNDGEFAHLDLNGKIIVKAEYGNNIRKIPILNDEITYDELVLMMQRLFKLQPTDEIELKYRDEDNDLVSIMDGNDLSFAIQCSRLLKLKLFVNSKSSSVSFNERKVIRGELIEIRNRCIELLDKLDVVNGDVLDSSLELKEIETDTSSDKEQKAQKVLYEPPKELDPLNKRAPSPVATVEAESIQQTTENRSIKDETTLGPQASSGQAENQPLSVAQQPVLQQSYPAPPMRSNQFSAPPPPSVPSSGPPPGQMFQPPPPAFSQSGFNQAPPSSIARSPSSVGMPPGSMPPQGGMMPPPGGMPSMPMGGMPPPQMSGPPQGMPGQSQGPPLQPPSPAFSQSGFNQAPPSSIARSPSSGMQPGSMPPPQMMSGPPQGMPGQSQGPPLQPPPSAFSQSGFNQAPPSSIARSPSSGMQPGSMPPGGMMPPPGGMPSMPMGGMPPPQMSGPPQGMPGPPQGMPGPPQMMSGPPQGMPGQPQGPPQLQRPPFGPPPIGQGMPPTSMPGGPGGPMNPYAMPQRQMRYNVNPYMSAGDQQQQQQQQQ